MANSVACCYLTYNHPEVIEQVLGQICESYGKHNIDIYVYDSSEGDETQLIVNKYQALNLCNLYYVDVRDIHSGDAKLLYVIQGNGLNHHYDYIWPTKDRCFFRGKALDDIVQSIDVGYDVVFAVDEGDRWEPIHQEVKDEYNNPVEFFDHYGQLTTNWEAVIRRTSTMLDGIDWDDYESKYRLGPDNNFNQTVTLFARLSELDNCCIKVIHHEPNDKLYSPLTKSMWRSQIIKVWIDTWIPAIFGLPSIYDPYKMKIIKSELGLAPIFGSIDSLVEMYESGQLDSETFIQLEPIWPMITDLPIEYAKTIMDGGADKSFYQSIADELFVAFQEKEYKKAYMIFYANNWLSKVMDKDIYSDLALCFGIYKNEIARKGYSILFDGVSSIDELLGKYYRLKNA